MEISRTAVPVETRAPTGTTNVYVLGDSDAVLIDPAARTPELDGVVAERDIAHIAVTHHHRDHVGAVDHYATATGATVWCRLGRADDFRAATGRVPNRTFTDGTAIPVGDRSVRVRDTPGHAPEHVAFATPRGYLCGDLAIAEGSVTVGAPAGDMRAYVSSLRRVRALAPDALYPGHGPVIQGRDAVRETLDRLLAHRGDREIRVRAAVEAGARTTDEILAAAYEKDLTGVSDLAAATVRAHLEKLAVEGALQWDGDRVTPRR